MNVSKKLMILMVIFWLPTLAEKPTVEQVKDPDPQFEALRESMIKISRQLGVTCTYCHNVKNYKDTSMKTHKVSKDHIVMVETLNKQFKGKIPTVDCYMCHRGKAVPDFKEKLTNF